MPPTACMSRGLLNQYVAGFAACLSALTSATCYSYTTPLLPRLLSPSSELPLTPSQLTWVISIIELGCLLSPLPAGLLSNHVGRKLVLLSSAPLFMLSWTIVLYYQTALGLAVARFIQGFTIGIVCTTAPVYLGEIASPKERGSITSMFTSVWWLGFLLEYSVGPHLTFTGFTYFTMLLNIPFCLAFLWQPETPAFYLLQCNEEKATRSLLYFRDGSIDAIKREIDEMKMSLEVNRKPATFRELVATGVDRKGLSILLVIITVRIFSGNSVITVYATHIFEQIPELQFTADNITISLGVVMFAGSIVSTFLSDSVGRRPLLLVSCIGSFVCHLCSGMYFFFLTQTSVDVSGWSWLPPVSIILYSGLYCSGLNPVSIAYTSELFRSTTRGVASSLSTINMTVLVFVLLSIYEPIIHDFGMYANFFLYALACLGGCIYFYLYAPETRGKSFFQIRKELCGGTVSQREDPEREPLFVDVDVDLL
ncbi:facilitated trehalose transporter Tret1-like [Macrosteles quadrilineatus]|uniref:facilitated trehalose transporter Tret1-like n=1 Tax=Macrosteles quadrilineatus TaxID=74068 RepID=UPI0023E0AC49|nr:facilitated trehalose transporter Tret1-like [Macrosteles quadrilineatus]